MKKSNIGSALVGGKRKIKNFKKPCNEYKNEYMRYLCGHPDKPELYLNKKSRNKCSDYIKNNLKYNKDFIEEFIEQELEQKKKIAEKPKKKIDKKEYVNPVAHLIGRSPNLRIAPMEAGEGVRDASMGTWKLPKNSKDIPRLTYKDYLNLGDNDKQRYRDKYDKNLLPSGSKFLPFKKGGYFLPEDEENINRQLVDNAIQKIIKARGASYGGCMDCEGDCNMFGDGMKLKKKKTKKVLSAKQKKWINKVKDYAKNNNITYKEALIELGK